MPSYVYLIHLFSLIHFFPFNITLLCQVSLVVHGVYLFIISLILTEFNLRIKLSVTDILFGINNLSNRFDPRDQRRINSVLLIAKVSISIFKKTNAHSDIFSLFINQWQLRTTILSSLYWRLVWFVVCNCWTMFKLK